MELELIPNDGTTAQIARQRELAQHCYRMAKTRNPRDYGDKIAQEISCDSGGVTLLTVNFVGPGDRLEAVEGELLEHTPVDN